MINEKKLRKTCTRLIMYFFANKVETITRYPPKKIKRLQKRINQSGIQLVPLNLVLKIDKTYV